ncbi:MAG: TolC family protein [Bacteroidales bacterium]|nr:TolC family protein [Bacteroidales bacterium]
MKHTPGIFNSVFFLFFSFTGIHAQDTISFKECIHTGIDRNYELRIVRNNEAITENNLTPGNAGFLPTVDAGGRISQSIVNSEQIFFSRPDEPQIRDNAKSTSTSGNVTLNWTVFDGFGMFARYGRLKDLLDEGRLNTRMNIENLIALIGDRYFNLIQQEKRLETFRYVMNLSRTRMKVAEERYRIGKESKLEFQQAKVDYNSDSSQYLKQQENLLSSRIMLNETMGTDMDSHIQPQEKIIVDFYLDYTQLHEQTIQNNTGLLIALNTQEVTEKDLKSINSRLYPVLSLTAGYNYNRSESQAGFQLSRKEHGYNYAAVLSYNLFNGFENSRQRQNAIISIKNSELQYENIKRQVLAELAIIYNIYQNSLKLIALEESNLQTARDNFEIAIEKFRLGTLSGLEMRDIQRVYLDAEDRLLSAQYQAKLAEISLKQISGRISEYL